MSERAVKKMAGKHFSIVGIPDTMQCPWCGGTMERKGPVYFGSGVNSYTMWCKCGGIIHFAKDSDRPIKSFEVTYKFKED